MPEFKVPVLNNVPLIGAVRLDHGIVRAAFAVGRPESNAVDAREVRATEVTVFSERGHGAVVSVEGIQHLVHRGTEVLAGLRIGVPLNCSGVLEHECTGHHEPC